MRGSTHLLASRGSAMHINPSNSNIHLTSLLAHHFCHVLTYCTVVDCIYVSLRRSPWRLAFSSCLTALVTPPIPTYLPTTYTPKSGLWSQLGAHSSSSYPVHPASYPFPRDASPSLIRPPVRECRCARPPAVCTYVHTSETRNSYFTLRFTTN